MKNAEFVTKNGDTFLTFKHTTMCEICSLMKRLPELDECDVHIYDETIEDVI